MRKLIGLAAAFAVVASLGGAELAASAPAEAQRVAICHKTKSKTRPYVRMVLANSRAHNGHPDDIIPAPRRCPQTLLTARSGGTVINVTLRGVLEQPTPGDADGRGNAILRLRVGQARVCYTLNVADIQLPATGAHIHQGDVGAAGNVVVPLANPNASGQASGCATVARTLVRQLLTNRTQYYVNVHTSDFPGGALRGQLAMPATARLFVVSLTGAAERPGPGDPDGAGLASVLILTDSGRLCYTLTARNIALPATGAHIHRGTATEAGPVVVPLANPNASGVSSGCVTPAAALLTEIAGNPAGFYVNVHTGDFPAGAIRGQLA